MYVQYTSEIASGTLLVVKLTEIVFLTLRNNLLCNNYDTTFSFN